MYNIRPKHGLTLTAIAFMAVGGVHSLTACGLLGDQVTPRNPTAEELRSSVAIKKLSTLKEGLEQTFAAVLKGADSAVKKEIDETILMIVNRTMSSTEKAELAYESLRNMKFLVKLSGSTSRKISAIRNVRQTSAVFGADLMKTVLDTYSDDASSLLSNLWLSPQTSAEIAERLDRSYTTFSHVASGIEGKASTDKEKYDAAQTVKKIETTLKTLPRNIVTSLLESLDSVVTETNAAQPANAPAEIIAARTLSVTVSIINLGETLNEGINKKQLTQEAIAESLTEWKTSIKEKIENTAPNVIIATESIAPPPLPVIDALSGQYADTLADWEFVLTTPPTMGNVDLTQNPPKYSPSENFTNNESYGFRLCHKTFKHQCCTLRCFGERNPQGCLLLVYQGR
jgi:hypothetical protein